MLEHFVSVSASLQWGVLVQPKGRSRDYRLPRDWLCRITRPTTGAFGGGGCKMPILILSRISCVRSWRFNRRNFFRSWPAPPVPGPTHG